MTQPIPFDAATPRLDLPLLAAAQAQKEAFVNEALARIDVLLHPVVKGSTTAPPSNPQAGECWVVAATASDAWSEREEMLACWDGEQWTFCQPLAGMHVYNADSGERWVYRDEWIRAERPDEPSGGAVVDAQAREAIVALIDKLATLAIFPDD